MKRNRMYLVILVLATWAMLGASCAIFPKTSVCDTLESPSYLCDISKKYGVRLEDVGNGLIIANAVAIGQGLYTKEQALVVLMEIRVFLDNPISYAAFKAHVYEQMDAYPGLLEVATVYFSELGENTMIMFKADRDLLAGWLDKQIGILGK